MNKTIYLSLHNNFFDKIIIKKREEIYNIIIKKINFKKIKSILDVGATEESSYQSSNYLTKKFKFVKNIYGLSNQNINKSFYTKVIKKSIVNKLSIEEINSKREECENWWVAYKTDLQEFIKNRVLDE